jgi:hypothetical protein
MREERRERGWAVVDARQEQTREGREREGETRWVSVVFLSLNQNALMRLQREDFLTE